LDHYSAISLKQQSGDRYVAPLGHIILIPTQPVLALSAYCCMLRGEATNTNFIVFGLTISRLEPTAYHTRGEHYTTNPSLKDRYVPYSDTLSWFRANQSFLLLLQIPIVFSWKTKRSWPDPLISRYIIQMMSFH
jgi:hypothetical protein